MKNTTQKSFLKWAGNKTSIIEVIKKSLPNSTRLYEPFLGSGSVFLNTDYSQYYLNDINPDLINTFIAVRDNPSEFIADLSVLFNPANNNKCSYNNYRDEFNSIKDNYRKSLLFIYLNRHGFQGICRYNLKGGFNVPYGYYKNVYFPRSEILAFSDKAKNATFTCKSFSESFNRARAGDVIYCDPPYIAYSKTSNFTAYSKGGFSLSDQNKLVDLTITARDRGVHVVISNHNIEATQALYKDANDILELLVKRSLNPKQAPLRQAPELLAIYSSNFEVA